MRKSIFITIQIILFSQIFFAQASLDSLMFEYRNKFWSEKEYVFVQGRLCNSFNKELNNLYNEWMADPNIKVKYEDQLDSVDLIKHLNFFGPIKSYKYLKRYLPSAISITKNGFEIGDHLYNDSLDAINIISTNGDRRFQLGNSFEAAKSLWTTFQDISQYFIMQNYAIVRHGFLNNDQYDSSKDYDVNILRKQQLKKYETKYYSFYYDPSIFNPNQNKDSLFALEDDKIDDAIKILHLKQPQRKIQCYLYKSLEQKYYLSATPGYGNPFIKAYQNHSVGFGPVEHESIHVLMGEASTLFSEGIVGYYYSIKDSNELKKDKYTLANHPEFTIKDFLNTSNNFDFSKLSYAAATLFAKYMIDTYGLEKFKLASEYEDIRKAFEIIYSAKFNDIIKGWNKHYKRGKIKLGPERDITFQIVSNCVPDTSSIYITGDNVKLGNWIPDSIRLVPKGNGIWSRKFSFAEGSILSYKITRGSWEKEALDKYGNIPANSVLEVAKDSTIIVKINKWKDQ